MYDEKITLNTRIFCTGCVLAPYQLPDGSWTWILATDPVLGHSLADECYSNGVNVYPVQIADDIQQLYVPSY
jgi:hypothetical protein